MDTGRGTTVQQGQTQRYRCTWGQGRQPQGSWRAHGSIRGTIEGALCGGTQKGTYICTSPPQGDGLWGGMWGLAKEWLSAKPTALTWDSWDSRVGGRFMMAKNGLCRW